MIEIITVAIYYCIHSFFNNIEGLITGDKLLYTVSDGSSVKVLLTPNATTLTTVNSGTEFYVHAFEGGFHLASSTANLAAGQFLRFDVNSWNNGATHNLILNNSSYLTVASLPGNDQVYGGSGDDILVSYGLQNDEGIKIRNVVKDKNRRFSFIMGRLV